MAVRLGTRVADEVWIVTALLHRERPDAEDFSVEEILRRVTEENLAGVLRPGVYVHIVQHCVANRAPNPGRYRMLLETAEGRRRLFRKGDPYHPGRDGAKIIPDREEIPAEYRPLLEWYAAWEQESQRERAKSDPLLRLQDSGKELWKDEPADRYVERLREGW